MRSMHAHYSLSYRSAFVGPPCMQVRIWPTWRLCSRPAAAAAADAANLLHGTRGHRSLHPATSKAVNGQLNIREGIHTSNATSDDQQLSSDRQGSSIFNTTTTSSSTSSSVHGGPFPPGCDSEMFAALKDWVQLYGSCYVPSNVHDHHQLARWVTAVRRKGSGKSAASRDRDAFTAEQRAALDSLGFIWNPNQADAMWHSFYHRARAWCEARGGAERLQQFAQDAEERDAALLLARQQAQREKQQRGKGESKQREIPVKQGSQDAPSVVDIERPSHQVDGSTTLPSDYDEDTKSLVTWLRRQMELYRNLKLTNIKVQLLRRLGIKLRRQKGGPTPEELHPGLRYAEGPAAREVAQRVLRVSAKTHAGIRVAFKLSQELRKGVDVWALLHDVVGGQPDTAQGEGEADNRGGELLQEGDHPTQRRQQQQQLLLAAAGLPATAQAFFEKRRFILLLNQLQRWYENYGRGAPVPPGVWDRPMLAEWVECTRQVHYWQQKQQQKQMQQQKQQQRQQQQQRWEPNMEEEEQQMSSAAVKEGDVLAETSREEAASRGGGGSGRPVVLLRGWQEIELRESGFSFKPDNPENLEWHAAFHRLRRFKALKGGTLLQQETQSQQQQEDSMPGGQNNAPVAQGNGSSTSSRQYDRELGEALRWLQLQREAAKRGWLTGERSKLMMQLLGRWWVDGPGNAW